LTWLYSDNSIYLFVLCIKRTHTRICHTRLINLQHCKLVFSRTNFELKAITFEHLLFYNILVLNELWAYFNWNILNTQQSFKDWIIIKKPTCKLQTHIIFLFLSLILDQFTQVVLLNANLVCWTIVRQTTHVDVMMKSSH